MTSKEISEYIENNKVDQLYTKFKSVFELVDRWNDRLLRGDLLNENELAQLIDQATGAFGKLSSVAGVMEAYRDNVEQDTTVVEYKKLGDAVMGKHEGIIKATARQSINQYRLWYADFNNYAGSADKMIMAAQSRLKRLVVEGGARSAYRTGEPSIERNSSTGDPLPQQPSSTCAVTPNLGQADGNVKKGLKWQN